MFSITASALLKVVLASTTIFQTVTTNDQIIVSDGTSQILNITGMISVKNSTHDIGYVSNGRATEFHPYQYTTVIDNALRVSVNVSSRDPIDLLTLNSPSNAKPVRHCYAAMRGVWSGSSDIGPGSSDYQVLMATYPTPPYSPPVIGPRNFTIESAIWRYDTLTRAITAHYVNTNLSTPENYIGLWYDVESSSSGKVFIITGDKEEFVKKYGTTEWVTFELL